MRFRFNEAVSKMSDAELKRAYVTAQDMDTVTHNMGPQEWWAKRVIQEHDRRFLPKIQPAYVAPRPQR